MKLVECFFLSIVLHVMRSSKVEEFSRIISTLSNLEEGKGTETSAKIQPTIGKQLKNYRPWNSPNLALAP